MPSMCGALVLRRVAVDAQSEAAGCCQRLLRLPLQQNTQMHEMTQSSHTAAAMTAAVMVRFNESLSMECVHAKSLAAFVDHS